MTFSKTKILREKRAKNKFSISKSDEIKLERQKFAL